jgi:hypothetical protein
MSDTAARRARTDPSAELCGLLAALRLAPREPELFALVFGAADANSLGRIAQTCRLAAAKSIARDGGELSPVEEAARLQVLRRCPSASASALPVQFADSWLRTLWCLERRPGVRPRTAAAQRANRRRQRHVLVRRGDLLHTARH